MKDDILEVLDLADNVLQGIDFDDETGGRAREVFARLQEVIEYRLGKYQEHRWKDLDWEEVENSDSEWFVYEK